MPRSSAGMPASRAKIAIGWLLMAFAPALAGAQPHQRAMTDMVGRWINPRGSVMVETQPCGVHLCGRVSWASPEALQDARDAGIQSLIGIELLQDYSRSSSGIWHGRVYVPDMGRTFFSTIDLKSPDTLRISGCILGGLICKSQIWRRQF